MNYTTLLSICILFALSPLAAQQPDLEDLNTEAYLSMLDADTLLEQDKQQEALPLYQQALQSYQQLKSLDPDFKSTIVDYRIEILKEKIASLGKRVPQQADDTSTATASTVAPNTLIQDNYETLYLETREKMLRDAARLLELEKRNIEMVMTLRENQQIQNHQQTLLQELRKQVSDGEAQQQRSTAALQKEVQDLTRFNTLLQERTDRLESSSQDLTAERDELRNTIQERNLQLSEQETAFQKTKEELASKKLDATQSEQRLILSRNQLRDDLDAAKRDLETAHKVAAQAAEKIAEVALLEETVIELNNRNEQLTTRLREAHEQMATLVQERDAREVEHTTLQTLHASTVATLESLSEENAAWDNRQEQENQAQSESRQAMADLENELIRARKELEKRYTERETAIEKLTEIREEVKTTREVTRNLRRAESELEKAQKEVDKLRLNFQQEQKARTQLQTTVEQQLKTTTERMNEIIGLRREIAELKAQIPLASEVTSPQTED